MKYYQEGAGQITQERFEAELGPNVVVEQSSGAIVTGLEVSRPETHMSCIVYLDQEPPPGLGVRRQNGGDLVIKDWKFEGGEWFCPVGIAGGPYDARDPAQKGPFTLSMVNTLTEMETFVLSGVGWDHNENHQHPNVYVSLRAVQPPPPPPPPPPPDPDINQVRAFILHAKALLDDALELLEA